MSFDPAVESPIPLSDVSKLEWLPRRQTGREIHVATILRWVKFGLAGVRLEAVRIGATLCTSEPALRRFSDADAARQAEGPRPDPLQEGPHRRLIPDVQPCRFHPRARSGRMLQVDAGQGPGTTL